MSPHATSRHSTALHFASLHFTTQHYATPHQEDELKASVASVTIVGIAPMTHSHQHGGSKFEDETHDDYDARTWRSKLNTEVRDGKQVIVIPAHGFHQMLEAAARYSKRQIPGQGKATWTAKFSSGIALMANPIIAGIDPATVNSRYDQRQCRWQARQRQARAGAGGSRLSRWALEINGRWSTILDPDHHRTDLSREILEDEAGIFVGLRPVCPRATVAPTAASGSKKRSRGQITANCWRHKVTRHATAPHCTTQHNTQHHTPQHITAPHCTPQKRTTQHRILSMLSITEMHQDTTRDLADRLIAVAHGDHHHMVGSFGRNRRCRRLPRDVRWKVSCGDAGCAA